MPEKVSEPNWARPSAGMTKKKTMKIITFSALFFCLALNFAFAAVPDTKPPTGSIKINKGVSSTNNVNITLTLSAKDTGSGVGQMEFSNDNLTWSTLEPYKATKEWVLTPDNGAKKVSVKFKDKSGNSSTAYFGSIILDTIAPIISGITISKIDAKSAIISWVTNEQTFTQIEYGQTTAYGLKSPLPKSPASSRKITLNNLRAYTLYHYRVISKDSAGNQIISDDFTFTTKDIQPPTGSIKINKNALTTDSSNVILDLLATDTGSGVAQMKFSNDNLTWSTPELYKTTKKWILSSGSGAKKVYVKFKDNSENWSTAYSDSITLTNQIPQAGAIIPSSGQSTSSETALFTATYTDNNGWQDILEALLLINDKTNNKNCFYGSYNRKTNKLCLRDNADSKWLGSFTPGSTKIIENSYAKLDCSKTVISGSNATLTITWAVTFKSAFQGAKNTYLYVKDNANASSNWVKTGSWEITGQPPQIASIEPPDNSTFLSGAKITIKINSLYSGADSLEYQFSLGGAVQQPWSNLNTYLWQTKDSDTSAVSVTCDIRNTTGKTASKTITLHIINPTVEEALQKAAENHAKISDFTADMSVSSTLNGKPLEETQYCRYYFKAPNKEKTETYSNSAKTIKIDAIIINGSNMYLIDPVNKTTQEVNLLAEAGIDSTQFNQTDLYYNQAGFLSNHTVTKNNIETDFLNMIICFDAVPKEPSNLYSKLELCVDYNKGLLTKITHYKNDELPQAIEVTESKQMVNGAWLASKIKKTPNLTAGDLVVILSYSNIQTNTGLTNLDFDPKKQ